MTSTSSAARQYLEADVLVIGRGMAAAWAAIGAAHEGASVLLVDKDGRSLPPRACGWRHRRVIEQRTEQPSIQRDRCRDKRE
jgi:glycine/D-amino acid oxidase-like deaminating enzyme